MAGLVVVEVVEDLLLLLSELLEHPLTFGVETGKLAARACTSQTQRIRGSLRGVAGPPRRAWPRVAAKSPRVLLRLSLGDNPNERCDGGREGEVELRLAPVEREHRDSVVACHLPS